MLHYFGFLLISKTSVGKFVLYSNININRHEIYFDTEGRLSVTVNSTAIEVTNTCKRLDNTYESSNTDYAGKGEG